MFWLLLRLENTGNQSADNTDVHSLWNLYRGFSDCSIAKERISKGLWQLLHDVKNYDVNKAAFSEQSHENLKVIEMTPNPLKQPQMLFMKSKWIGKLEDLANSILDLPYHPNSMA